MVLAKIICKREHYMLAMPGGTSRHSKHTLNTQHTRIHMLPHPSYYVMFMFYKWF
jgi:hypothetical protein